VKDFGSDICVIDVVVSLRAGVVCQLPEVFVQCV
jgi:hypothetical protein